MDPDDGNVMHLGEYVIEAYGTFTPPPDTTDTGDDD